MTFGDQLDEAASKRVVLLLGPGCRSGGFGICCFSSIWIGLWDCREPMRIWVSVARAEAEEASSILGHS